MSLFSGILDQVPGAVFAISPYTQLSRAQTQSIEVRETGGDTEEIFGPESQAAIEAFVNQEVVQYESDFTDNITGWTTTGAGAISHNSTDGTLRTTYAEGDRGGPRKGDLWFAGFTYRIKIRAKRTSGDSAVNWDLRSTAGLTYETKSISANVTDTAGNNGFTLNLTSDYQDFLVEVKVLVAGSANLWLRSSVDATEATIIDMDSFEFTQLTADGRIATAYNQGSEAADAVQATADNQPFIATAGVLEDGMRFAVGQRLDIANGPRLTTGGTLSAWVYRFSSGGTGVGRIFDKGVHYRLYNNSSGFIRLDLDGTNVIGGAGSFVPLDTWVHVTAVFSANSQKLYLNGSEVLTATADKLPPDLARSVSIGNVFNGFASGWDGKIRSAIIWPRALTSAELTKVYNATDPR